MTTNLTDWAAHDRTSSHYMQSSVRPLDTEKVQATHIFKVTNRELK